MVVALIVSKDCSQVDRVLVETLISLGIVAVKILSKLKSQGIAALRIVS